MNLKVLIFFFLFSILGSYASSDSQEEVDIIKRNYKRNSIQDQTPPTPQKQTQHDVLNKEYIEETQLCTPPSQVRKLIREELKQILEYIEDHDEILYRNRNIERIFWAGIILILVLYIIYEDKFANFVKSIPAVTNEIVGIYSETLIKTVDIYLEKTRASLVDENNFRISEDKESEDDEESEEEEEVENEKIEIKKIKNEKEVEEVEVKDEIEMKESKKTLKNKEEKEEKMENEEIILKKDEKEEIFEKKEEEKIGKSEKKEKEKQFFMISVPLPEIQKKALEILQTNDKKIFNTHLKLYIKKHSIRKKN